MKVNTCGTLFIIFFLHTLIQTASVHKSISFDGDQEASVGKGLGTYDSYGRISYDNLRDDIR